MIPNTQFSLAIFGETIRAVISRDAPTYKKIESLLEINASKKTLFHFHYF